MRLQLLCARPPPACPGIGEGREAADAPMLNAAASSRSRSTALYQIGKCTSVTICRELKHSHQIIKSEHSGTDRLRKTRTTGGFCNARLSNGHCHPDDEDAAGAHMVAFLTAGIRSGTPVRLSAPGGSDGERTAKLPKSLGKKRKSDAFGDIPKKRHAAKGRRVS
jgi:hypothetical protein